MKKQTIKFQKKPSIISSYSIVGPKEGEGQFGKHFDKVLDNDVFEEKTFEKAETKMLVHATKNSIKKAKLQMEDIDLLVSGDLLNQTISSNFMARELSIPFLGLYGACSTMAEGLCVAGAFLSAGFLKTAVVSACSHFSSAERQYRYPLELGNQRTPTSQWTTTGAGALVLKNKEAKKGDIVVESITIGKVIDLGIKDVNNMGAAMAPACAHTIKAHLTDTKRNVEYYDLIVSGDLGRFGSEILIDLLKKEDITLTNHFDCGKEIYTEEQKVVQGGSGAGCSAVVLASYILDEMKKEKLNRVLFVATGALLSPTSSFQGETIPSIAHAVSLERV